MQLHQAFFIIFYHFFCRLEKVDYICIARKTEQTSPAMPINRTVKELKQIWYVFSCEKRKRHIISMCLFFSVRPS